MRVLPTIGKISPPPFLFMKKIFLLICLILLTCFDLQADTKKTLPLLYLNYGENKIPPLTQEQTRVIDDLIDRVAAGNDSFASVDALNNYSFSVLSNKLLGNLYKSHGCLHVSPRNSFLLYELLPLGAKVTVYPYDKKVDQALFESLPYIADLIDSTDDLNRLIKFTRGNKENIEFVVYPFSGAWIGYLNKKPVVRILVEAGPKHQFYLMQERDGNGNPIFQPNLAYPTKSGVYYIFKKVINYVSNYYRDLTVVPQGAIIKRVGSGWQYQNENGKWLPLTKDIVDDLSLPEDKRLYEYYLVRKDGQGKMISARWGGNTFGRYSIILSKDKKTMDPQLIHSSGDLMMEERSVMGDVINMLLATPEAIDDCIPATLNYDLYKTCHDFVSGPNREGLIEPVQSGNYKVFFDLPLTPDEAAVVPKDILIAYKVAFKGAQLTVEEKNLLVKEGLAKKSGDKTVFNYEKLYGVLYDAYQYVVAVRKNAQHYSALNDNWNGLKPVKQALLADVKKFPPEIREVFDQFVAEMIVERALLHKLTQKRAAEILSQFLEL